MSLIPSRSGSALLENWWRFVDSVKLFLISKITTAMRKQIIKKLWEISDGKRDTHSLKCGIRENKTRTKATIFQFCFVHFTVKVLWSKFYLRQSLAQLAIICCWDNLCPLFIHRQFTLRVQRNLLNTKRMHDTINITHGYLLLPGRSLLIMFAIFQFQ